MNTEHETQQEQGQPEQLPTVQSDTPKSSIIQLGEGGVSLSTMDELWRFSVAVSKSGLAPKGTDKPETILVAIQMGLELGLAPMMAVQNIAVINGKPSIYGDCAKALVMGSGVCEYIVETMEGEGDARVAVCKSKRLGAPNELETRFSVEDAKRARLWNKSGPWSEYPFRMLMFRARGFNLRDNFPDVLKGMKTTEEIADYQILSSKTGTSKVEKLG